MKKFVFCLLTLLVIMDAVLKTDCESAEGEARSPATVLLSSPLAISAKAPATVSTPSDAATPTHAPSSVQRQTAVPVIPSYTYNVVNSYPHDRNAFTQGLVIENGVLYEGTGLFGRSTLRRVDLGTGKIEQIRELPNRFFGEGITVFGNKIIQLTWRSRVGFIYDRNSFELLQEFNYPTEGWGITHNGKYIIMSDGTATLRFLDPDTFEEVRRVEIFDCRGSVNRLNELEYIQGEIFANVWKTDRIVRIAPETGQVTGWIELNGLLSMAERNPLVHVLNGIAYDTKREQLFVTGKNWPRLFQIELKPLKNSSDCIQNSE